MNYRLDKYGNQISILGFGCMRFPRKLGLTDMKETEREIDRALWMALQRHRAQKATKKRGRR